MTSISSRPTPLNIFLGVLAYMTNGALLRGRAGAEGWKRAADGEGWDSASGSKRGGAALFRRALAQGAPPGGMQ